ncbi:caspase family protein [Promicromonospora soli]
MSDHAVVIGCDAYPKVPNADLRGAVADALAVRSWLTTHGRVPVANVTLHAAPSAEGAQLEAGLAARPCTREALTQTLEELLARTDLGATDRLFVYFAGHGLRTDPLNPSLSTDALALQDLSRDPSSSTIGVADLVARLELTRFGQIVVVVDACRNLPYDRPFTISPLGFDPELPPGRAYWPDTYTAQATLPGGTAEGEESPDGIVHGYFTAALLRGLEGAGTAKRFDETASPPYRVTWSSLQGYVKQEVARQRPRMRGEGDLVLSVFPDGWFPESALTVRVEPEEAGRDNSLSIVVTHSDPTGQSEGTQVLAGPVPVTVQVPPRRQRIEVRRAESTYRVWSDVYEDAQDVTVHFDAIDPMTSMTGGTLVRSGLRHCGRVEIRDAMDPTAVIELRNSSNLVVKHGVGSLSGEVGAGPYTALVTSIGGLGRSVPLEVARGKVTKLDLPPAPVGAWPPRARREQRRMLNQAAELLDNQGLSSLPSGASLLALRAPENWAVEADPGLTEVGVDETQLHVWWERSQGDRWVRIAAAGHTLTLPVLRGLTTTAVLDGPEAQVKVFDRRIDRTDPLFARLDQVQELLSVGRRTTARLLMSALADMSEPIGSTSSAQSLLSRLLTAAVDDRTSAQPFLAVGVPASLRPYLLNGCIWAAFLDLPNNARSLL